MRNKKKPIITVKCNECNKQMIKTISYNNFNYFRAVISYYVCENCKKIIEIKITKVSKS